MPRTEEQYEEIREVRRRQIMDAALELFANEGYYTTSISKIAQKAGISKGLMYNYFSGKEELVRAIVHEGFQMIFHTFDQNRDGVLTDQELNFFMEENFRIIKENLSYWKLYYAIMAQPAVHHLVMQEMKDILPELVRIITNFFRQKGYDEPEMEALLFGALMDGIAFNFMMNPDGFPLDRMKDFYLKKINEKSNNTYKK